MKKIVAFFLCAIALVGLASCSTVNKIKKAFEKEDYIWNVEEVSEDAKANGIDGIYWVGKDGAVLKNVPHGIIIEFSAETAEDALKAIKEKDILTDDALSKIVSAFSSTPVTNGNCFIISIESSVISIFQNA